MIQFSFSCEHCGQVISCSDLDAGQNIDCPSCDRSLVIPTPAGRAHSAPVANPSAPHKPAPTRNIAPPTRSFSVPVAAPNAPIKRPEKKKSDSAVPLPQAASKGAAKGKSSAVAAIIGVTIALVGAGSGVWYFLGHKKPAPVAQSKQIEPVTVVSNTSEAAKAAAYKYSKMSSYSARIQSQTSVDMPKAGGRKILTEVSVKFGRPNLYRVEWKRSAGGVATDTGAAWCCGDGDYVLLPNKKYAKLPSRTAALDYASRTSVPIVGILAKLFFVENNAIFSVTGSGRMDKGTYSLTHNELRPANANDSVIMLFGEDAWRNYTLECEAMKLSGSTAFYLGVRARNDLDCVRLIFGDWDNTTTRLVLCDKNGIKGCGTDSHALLPIQNNRWYKLRLSVDGDLYSGSIDGVETGSVKVPFRSNGGVLLGTWTTSAVFRNVKVTAPDGTVLYSGVPCPLIPERDDSVGQERCNVTRTYLEGQKLLVWTTKKSVVAKTALSLGGGVFMDDAWLTDEVHEMGVTSLSLETKMKAQVLAARTAASKLHGSITDVVQYSELNFQFVPEEFRYDLPADARLVDMPF